MHQSPFRAFHEQHHAHFVDFAGWEMPIRYGSIKEEHLAVRESGGLFDVSHMGRVRFKGRQARRFLERVLTRKVSDMAEKQCRYAMVCNERGGVLDDVLVYRFADDWLAVVNAANREKLLAHFERVKAEEGFSVDIQDQTCDTAMVAVQGPKVMDMIGQFSKEVPTLKKYRFTTKNLLVLKMTISRTGYTGEDGVEVILGAKMAQTAIKMLLKDQDDQPTVRPAGLGARDTLRLEAGMPLYGHELDEDTNPLEAGLGFAVSLDKDANPGEGPPVPRFIGQDALERVQSDGPAKTLVGLQLGGKRTPRQGATVKQADAEIGTVTSGCLSPSLGVPIAMAYVQPDAVAAGDTVHIEISGKPYDAVVVKLPFYKR